MQVALIGLGRMGMNMARRLLRGGHEVWAFNRTAEKVTEIAKEGAKPLRALAEIQSALKAPRVVWVMLPAGETTDAHIRELSSILQPGDLIVDGGNSYYRDDLRRAEELKPKRISYMDAGVSGGIWGLELGYCTMVGGSREEFQRIEPLLKTLAPTDGYLHCGAVGSGHYVKMVHNGIEYALMQAYGEGFELLKASRYGTDLNLGDVAKLWNRGSVIRSWLLELAERALANDPDLSKIEGYVEDSGEGRWTVLEAVDSSVPATAIAHSLFKRFQSRDKNQFSDRVVAALRREFGGHATKAKH